MSAIIKNLVLRKRQSEADQLDRARFLAAAKGDTGPQGPKGDTGPMPAHQWQGTKLRFEQADGTWGKYTDLKGKDGKEGAAGRVVVLARGGSSGTDLADLLPGSENAEPTGVVVYQGGQAVNLPWQAFLAIVGNGDETYARRVDFVGEDLLYRGEALPGASESAASWRIRKIDFLPGGDVVETWAAGDSDFDKVWLDRAALSYE